MTRLTLNSKMDLVVLLTVGGAILADVLPGQHFAAGLTLEAAQVPLSVQGKKSLSVLNVSATSGTVAGAQDVLWSWRHGLDTVLTQTVLPVKGHPVPGRERSFADGADEAGRVVGLAQGSDHFSLNKIPAAIAAGAVHSLVVQRAQIFSILHEEAPLGEVTATHFTGEALEVKVLVLHPQHFAFTWLPALVALNQGLLCGVVVCVLRMSHFFFDHDHWNPGISAPEKAQRINHQ